MISWFAYRFLPLFFIFTLSQGPYTAHWFEGLLNLCSQSYSSVILFIKILCFFVCRVAVMSLCPNDSTHDCHVNYLSIYQFDKYQFIISPIGRTVPFHLNYYETIYLTDSHKLSSQFCTLVRFSSLDRWALLYHLIDVSTYRLQWCPLLLFTPNINITLLDLSSSYPAITLGNGNNLASFLHPTSISKPNPLLLHICLFNTQDTMWCTIRASGWINIAVRKRRSDT